MYLQVDKEKSLNIVKGWDSESIQRGALQVSRIMLDMYKETNEIEVYRDLKSILANPSNPGEFYGHHKTVVLERLKDEQWRVLYFDKDIPEDERNKKAEDLGIGILYAMSFVL